jgi:DTW domain-containing protein
VTTVSPDREPRAVCARCTRPLSVCVCAALVQIATRTRILILQHPRERAVPIGTAKLAELAFPNSARHVGVDFTRDRAVTAALGDREAPPILLYPGPSARNLSERVPAQPVTLVALDGTWAQASKIFKANPLLATLPRYALAPALPSRYRIRRAPAHHCISTIEALVQALELLEGDDCDVARALAPFETMVETQLEFAKRCQRRHLHRKRPARPSPGQRLLAARSSDLVVGYGEASAWPKCSARGRHPEIVHWAAERPVSGERFEALIAPRHELSPSFEAHTRVSKEHVLAGESWPSFCRRWAAFTRPNDLLCSWGHFATELLRLEGAPMPERLDIRDLARRELRRKPGDVCECALSLGADPTPSGVPGRTGLRLDGLAAVVRALALASRPSARCAAPARK